MVNWTMEVFLVYIKNTKNRCYCKTSVKWSINQFKLLIVFFISGLLYIMLNRSFFWLGFHRTGGSQNWSIVFCWDRGRCDWRYVYQGREGEKELISDESYELRHCSKEIKDKATYKNRNRFKVVLRPKATKTIIIFFFGFQNYVN